MPPHPHHPHHPGGGGWGGGWGWGGYPMWGGDSTTIVVADPGCTAYDLMGRPIKVPCPDVLGDDVPQSDGATRSLQPLPPMPIMRTAWNVVNGKKSGGSTPYYHFAAQARSYPFDWNGRPGGVPQGHRAGESSELSGGGDLLESGLNPYATKYPPLSKRGLRMGPQSAFSGILDFSDNEKILAVGAAVAAGAFLLWKSRKKKRRNPCGRRRGR